MLGILKLSCECFLGHMTMIPSHNKQLFIHKKKKMLTITISEKKNVTLSSKRHTRNNDLMQGFLSHHEIARERQWDMITGWQLLYTSCVKRWQDAWAISSKTKDIFQVTYFCFLLCNSLSRWAANTWCHLWHLIRGSRPLMMLDVDTI